MNIYSTTKYLEYRLFSTHRKGYGIHSPFVFHLVSEVFRNKTGSDIVLNIESIRKNMLSDFRMIEVKDFGAGSTRFKGNLRKVSDIARYSAVPKKYGILLSSMANEFGQRGIIELGTSLGISTMYLASGCKEAAVYTIEGCSKTAAVAKEYFHRSSTGNIEMFIGSFDEMVPVIAEKNFTPGLIYIDGDHRGGALKKNFEALARISDNNTVMMIDDINHSAEMSESWKWIKNHPRVTLTVDIYRMGLVFFRRGITRSDYVIRY